LLEAAELSCGKNGDMQMKDASIKFAVAIYQTRASRMIDGDEIMLFRQ